MAVNKVKKESTTSEHTFEERRQRASRESFGGSLPVRTDTTSLAGPSSGNLRVCLLSDVKVSRTRPRGRGECKKYLNWVSEGLPTSTPVTQTLTESGGTEGRGRPHLHTLQFVRVGERVWAKTRVCRGRRTFVSTVILLPKPETYKSSLGSSLI